VRFRLVADGPTARRIGLSRAARATVVARAEGHVAGAGSLVRGAIARPRAAHHGEAELRGPAAAHAGLWRR
jgi:hypothetical protein